MSDPIDDGKMSHGRNKDRFRLEKVEVGVQLRMHVASCTPISRDRILRGGTFCQQSKHPKSTHLAGHRILGLFPTEHVTCLAA